MLDQRGGKDGKDTTQSRETDLQLGAGEGVEMSHAQVCPICGGSGLVPDFSGSTSTAPVTCHGCHGKGWVTVRG